MTMDSNNHEESAEASPTRANTSPTSQPSSTEQSPTRHDAARSRAQLSDDASRSHNAKLGEPHSEAGQSPATRPHVVRDLSESTTSAAAGSAPSARPTDQTQVGVSDRSAKPPLTSTKGSFRKLRPKARAAKTLREDIDPLAGCHRTVSSIRGVPFGAIHRGLKERALISCSRSRFDEICADLFPDFFKPSRRGNG